jgi:hypothetical protein
MPTNRITAVVVGLLFITATASGILFVAMTRPLLAAPDYLTTIAAQEQRFIIGALLQFTMGAAGAGIAIGLYPVLRRYNEALAIGAVGFRLMEAVLFVMAAVGLLTLVSLGREVTASGTPIAPHLQAIGTLIRAARDWAATGPAAIAFCIGAAMYYGVFYQTRLIPRWLALWGLIATGMHLIAVLLVMFGQAPFSMPILILNLPILVNELVLALWLIVRGFDHEARAAVTGPADAYAV